MTSQVSWLEHCNGIAEVMGSNPVGSPEFFRIMRQLLNLRILSSFDFKHRTSYITFLSYLINVTPMFSHFEAKTSPRLPSRFEATYKFCVEIPPDLPVPHLTLKEQLHIRQQSFA